MSRATSAVFGELHALDVSPGMIEYAKIHAGRDNIRYALISGNTIPLPDNSATAVFSTHVFQHLDSINDATRYFAEIHRVLRPGGTLMIHLPIHAWPAGMGPWILRVYRWHRIWDALKARLKRRAIRRGQFVPLMRMRSFPLDYLFGTIQSIGFSDAEIQIFRVRSCRGLHPCFLARKDGGALS